MGPNGSGKSTLAQVLARRETFQVTQGEALFNGKDLLAMKPEEAACEGLFMAFQYPVEIPGIMASKSLPLNSASPWVTWKVSRRASTCARVLLPEPFGPMMECTSPAFTFRLTPFRISWFSTLTCRFLISSMALSNTSFQAHAQQFLCLDSELHGQLAEHLFSEAGDDHRDRIFLRQAALLQIEELV